MHTVAILHAFERAAKAAGMTGEEVEALVDYLSQHPAAGDEMRGTGGCRKLRWPGRGKGKSGGYRTITFYSGNEMPVFLITVFSKGERADLSAGERSRLGEITKTIVKEFKSRIVTKGKKGA